jgi:hypothetical protein
LAGGFGDVVVPPPEDDVVLGGLDGSSAAAFSAARSVASADAGELGVGVEPWTSGPAVSVTPGSRVEVVSVPGASPRVNVRNAAAATVVITAPVMIRGNRFLDTGDSSCASAKGSVPAAPEQIIGRSALGEIV